MAEKRFYGRLVQKHDVQANWEKAVNFIPMTGEIIVYDPDDNYSYARVKVGDGETLVSNLPFLRYGTYVQDTEPVDAVAGDIWIDTANDPSYTAPTLPEITEADNGKVLMVVNGKLQLVTLNMSVDANGVLSI